MQMATRAPSWGLSPIDPKEYQNDKTLRDILSEMKGMPVLNIGFQGEGRKQLIDFLLAKFVPNQQSRTRLPNAEELLFEWVLLPFDLEEPIVILECAHTRLLINMNSEGKIWWLDEIPTNLGVPEAPKGPM